MFMKFENNSDSLRLRSRLGRGEKLKKKVKKIAAQTCMGCEIY